MPVENENQKESSKVISEAYIELIYDLAIAEQVLEDYEAQGIEGTTLYGEYRAKRHGSKT
jgi:hypothetical protein